MQYGSPKCILRIVHFVLLKDLAAECPNMEMDWACLMQITLAAGTHSLISNHLFSSTLEQGKEQFYVLRSLPAVNPAGLYFNMRSSSAHMNFLICT